MFKERLLNLRKAKNLTQQELSDKLHMSRATYAQYEIGRREPDFETLKKLAEFFHVSTDYLLGLTDDPSSHDVDEPTEQDLEELMRKGGLMFHGQPLDEEDREDILAAMRIVWQTIQKRKQK